MSEHRQKRQSFLHPNLVSQDQRNGYRGEYIVLVISR
jgi:hypothetical protein